MNLDTPSTASSAPSSPGSTTGRIFAKFPELPPELRHQIWQLAIPNPGVNFFNVHCIPNDHEGVNRSTSPPWLYLDLRRLSIDHGDAAVAQYDPSAWHARQVLRSVCREARCVCAIPDFEAATLTLTRPKRGLFVRAADGQIRRLTPLEGIDIGNESGTGSERLEYRKIRVRTEDMLCLSIENCSFNLPFEETAIENGGGFGGYPGFPEDNEDNEDDDELGWSYDPELIPPIPPPIPLYRQCINMARASKLALRNVQESVLGMLADRELHNLSQNRTKRHDGLPLVMFDALKQELGDRRVDELSSKGEIFWDRFGDRYVKLPWASADLTAIYRLTKVWPESNDIRERYLRSAMLQSPKRPAGLS
ncbi:hypothetical protein GGR54DRAFT_533726 [Hypoxylon sp. NC1633]|nr:hypothetical protein GGR54DRAFT_533726 [Hypoxylon sp. NC1633]